MAVALAAVLPVVQSVKPCGCDEPVPVERNWDHVRPTAAPPWSATKSRTLKLPTPWSASLYLLTGRMKSRLHLSALNLSAKIGETAERSVGRNMGCGWSHARSGDVGLAVPDLRKGSDSKSRLVVS